MSACAEGSCNCGSTRSCGSDCSCTCCNGKKSSNSATIIVEGVAPVKTYVFLLILCNFS
ncbi:hypothetical protein HanXRQr2_Chr01g0042791 [Helianthus annuus]|uniref:Uncharacterized protein n=1 Tax=Helianthus annuus TaxID=4232 RepID=A0A251VS32_HELAN|nr:hypothetical protein HanXRQr2_Chr01g0042791 [Helianthus annuus]